jgi:protein involved in polysaccharide export with SLBB domain
MLHRLLPALLSLPLALAAGCATAQGPGLGEIAERINATREPSDVVLAPGDRIEVKFANKLEWNHTVLVQNDGTAGFLSIDKQRVAGLLPEQLDEQLTKAYAEKLGNSDVSVIIEALGNRSISVLGEVLEPGEVVIPPGRHLTIVDAIARAGGHKKETAWMSSLVLVRWDAKTKKQLCWTIDARPEHWGEPDTVLLQPYDVVFIPNTPVDVVAIFVDNYMRRMIPFPYLIPTP